MVLKNCWECGKEISSDAATCPLCGKKNPHGSPIIRYGVGFLLLALTFPAIAGMLGHGPQAALASIQSTSPKEPSPATSAVAVAEQTPEESKPQASAASPSLEPQAKAEACVTEKRQLAELYHELKVFKNEREFKEVGFGPCCKYFGWFKRTESLRDGDRCSLETWVQQAGGVIPGDLLQLGLEYASSKGRETEYTRNKGAEFEAALRSKPAKIGFDKRTSRTDRYCRSLATLERSDDLALAGDNAGSLRVLSNDAACPRIPANTPMRGPLSGKQASKLPDIAYELMEVEGFGRVWVESDEE